MELMADNSVCVLKVEGSLLRNKVLMGGLYGIDGR